MKSFVTYPLDFEKMLFPEIAQTNAGKLFAHYELYKNVAHLEGTIVKCGIAAEDGFTKFAIFRNLITTHTSEKIIAFEKITKNLYFENIDADTSGLKYKTRNALADVNRLQAKLLTKGLAEIEFIPGNLDYSIPDFLMENPEFKISYLYLDLDDYEATLNVLDFFYLRVVPGGILIFDNYNKKEEDYKVVTDYFCGRKVQIHNFSVNKGPHFLLQQ